VAKYKQAALGQLKGRPGGLKPLGTTIPAATIFTEFLRLESPARENLREHDLYVPSKGAPRMSFSFRQMIQALRQSEAIESRLFEELMEIDKYPNLVFHGHVGQADAAMAERVRAAADKVRKLPPP